MISSKSPYITSSLLNPYWSKWDVNHAAPLQNYGPNTCKLFVTSGATFLWRLTSKQSHVTNRPESSSTSGQSVSDRLVNRIAALKLRSPTPESSGAKLPPKYKAIARVHNVSYGGISEYPDKCPWIPDHEEETEYTVLLRDFEVLKPTGVEKRWVIEIHENIVSTGSTQLIHKMMSLRFGKDFRLEVRMLPEFREIQFFKFYPQPNQVWSIRCLRSFKLTSALSIQISFGLSGCHKKPQRRSKKPAISGTRLSLVLRYVSVQCFSLSVLILPRSCLSPTLHTRMCIVRLWVRKWLAKWMTWLPRPILAMRQVRQIRNSQRQSSRTRFQRMLIMSGLQLQSVHYLRDAKIADAFQKRKKNNHNDASADDWSPKLYRFLQLLPYVRDLLELKVCLLQSLFPSRRTRRSVILNSRSLHPPLLPFWYLTTTYKDLVSVQWNSLQRLLRALSIMIGLSISESTLPYRFDFSARLQQMLRALLNTAIGWLHQLCTTNLRACHRNHPVADSSSSTPVIQSSIFENIHHHHNLSKKIHMSTYHLST